MQAQNKIKALLIGASGSAGKQIVSAATRKDFIVTCLLRNPGALGINSPWVRLEQGDVFNIEDLRRVMPEQEVVISTFGSKKFDEPVDDRTRAVTNLVTVMKEFGVKRIITLAGAGIANVKPDQLLSETPFYPANLQHVTKDHFGALKVLQESGLDYTVFAPTNIKAGPTAPHIVQADYFPENGAWDVQGVDLAQALLDEVRNNQYVQKRVVITNKKPEGGQPEGAEKH